MINYWTAKRIHDLDKKRDNKTGTEMDTNKLDEEWNGRNNWEWDDEQGKWEEGGPEQNEEGDLDTIGKGKSKRKGKGNGKQDIAPYAT